MVYIISIFKTCYEKIGKYVLVNLENGKNARSYFSNMSIIIISCELRENEINLLPDLYFYAAWL